MVLPIYGATRVLAEDYDLDGDWDFAVMAHFPDWDNSPNREFCFLENKIPNQFHFESFTVHAASLGRWLVMDDGDFDQDGDVDILLGSYLLPMEKKYNSVMDQWNDDPVNLLLLENTTIKHIGDEIEGLYIEFLYGVGMPFFSDF